MSEHLTLDELAELDAGLLVRRRAAQASRHLAECDECTAGAEALRRTQDRLRDLGGVAMPSDVAARLDRALRDAEGSSGSDVVPDLSEIRARRFGGLSPRMYAAAAAVVVLGGTAIAVGTLHHHKSSTDSALAPKTPLVATHAPVALQMLNTGRTYTPDSIDNLAAGLVSGQSESDLLRTSAPLSAAAPNQGSGGGTAAGTTSGKQFSSTNKVPAPSAQVPAAGETAPSVLAPLRHLSDSRQALLRCAAFITDTPNAAPLAVDFGRWTNKAAHLHAVPSVVFVFPSTSDPNTLDVYVVAAACDDGSVLDYQVLNKP